MSAFIRNNLAVTRRTLPTGCHGCAMSLLYCQCERELNHRPCCDACQHPDVDGA